MTAFLRITFVCGCFFMLFARFYNKPPFVVVFCAVAWCHLTAE